MDIKESFSKITEWAKKNPWLAGGILLVVVLVAWWVSKNSKGGSVSSLTEEEELPVLDAGSFGAGGSSSGLLDSISNNTGGVTQAPPQFDAPQFDSLPALDAMQGAGWFDPGAVSLQEPFYEAPSISGNAQTAQESGLYKSYISSSPVAAMRKPQNQVTETIQRLTTPFASSPVADMKKPTSSMPKSSGSSGGKAKTPAQLVGKGRLFSGLYQGVYYVLGYPQSGRVGGTISASPVAKMRKPGM